MRRRGGELKEDPKRRREMEEESEKEGSEEGRVVGLAVKRRISRRGKNIEGLKLTALRQNVIFLQHSH